MGQELILNNTSGLTGSTCQPRGDPEVTVRSVDFNVLQSNSQKKKMAQKDKEFHKVHLNKSLCSFSNFNSLLSFKLLMT
jgi:hypothetical protein